MAVLCGFVAILSIIEAIFEQSKTSTITGLCRRNAYQLVLGIASYAEDFDDRLPPNADDPEKWWKETHEYVGGISWFACPLETMAERESPSKPVNKSGWAKPGTTPILSYRVNPLLAELNVKFSDIPNPDSTAMIVERAENHVKSERYKHSITVGFASGRTRLIAYPQRFEAMNPFLPEGHTKN